jgi:hypothetical protein
VVHILPKSSLIAVSSFLLACLLLVAGCELIIGLEDHTLAVDGGTTDTDSALCKRYCSRVTTSCKAQELEAYANEENCLAVCALLPPGKADASETSRNTVSCRAHFAEEAATHFEEAEEYCPAAAPGGGSPGMENRCGDNCQAYCQLYGEVCSDVPNLKEQKNCMDKCRALPDRGSFGATTDFMGGDTIQCRLAHLTAAAVAKREANADETKLHCEHASLRASLGDRPYCDLPKASEPNCTDYCKLVDQACDANPVYASIADCEAFCKTLPPGKNTNDDGVQDSTSNTLACRRWHAYFAFDDAAATHCPHAGPSGDGHCGMPICAAYCSMLEQGSCKERFKTEFPGAGGKDTCVSACKTLTGGKDIDLGYNLNDERVHTNTFECRIAALVDASKDAKLCSKVFPEDTCMR